MDDQFARMPGFDAAQRHFLCERLTQIIAANIVREGDVVLDLGQTSGIIRNSWQTAWGRQAKCTLSSRTPNSGLAC